MTVKDGSGVYLLQVYIQRLNNDTIKEAISADGMCVA
jgi:hypothetical protein